MRERWPASTFDVKLSAFVLAIASLLVIPAARAQTYTVLHNFTGGTDGGNPYAGLTLDAAGNLYGTASGGGLIIGDPCCGTVYKLVPHSGGWTFSSLYSFQGNADGSTPQARVVFGPDGLLYGTTVQGGNSAYGTVYKLQPRPTISASISCEWKKTTLYSFGNYPDAEAPAAGDVVFDSAGNLYGATYTGGLIGCFDLVNPGCGAVYKLTPSSSGWQETVIYNFVGLEDGATPNGVAFDSSGHLDGTTSVRGGSQTVWGTVFFADSQRTGTME